MLYFNEVWKKDILGLEFVGLDFAGHLEVEEWSEKVELC
jgi:hypothetical protein